VLSSIQQSNKTIKSVARALARRPTGNLHQRMKGAKSSPNAGKMIGLFSFHNGKIFFIRLKDQRKKKR